MKRHLRTALSILSLFIPEFIYAAPVELTGVLSLDNGALVGGAMITLIDKNNASETTYTGLDGQWSITSEKLQPPIALRARAGAAYADVEVAINSATESPLLLTLPRLSDPKEISDRLTASAHAASVRWKSAQSKTDFISQCHFCHQIGNSYTRQPKTPEEWREVITRMEGYGALLTWKNEDEFSETLADSFNGTPIKNVQTLTMHDDLPKAKLWEWAFGGAVNYVHDIEEGVDGKLYGVDMSADLIWILDPSTNKLESIPLPPNDLPLGGMFSGAVAPLGTFNAYHGPHSIVRGPDNKMYITCSLSSEIAIFDPSDRKLEFINIGGDAIYPHTLRFDKEGTLWFTISLTNELARMDIRTREIELISLPANGLYRWLTDKMLPTILEVASWFDKKNLHVSLSHHKITGEGRDIFNLPYGIDINPIDGSVWYSKLYSGYIGRVDPETLEVKEYKTPYKAPRRLRFDAKGILWIPSFDEGVIMKFDAEKRVFINHYPLPLLAENEYETPYALAVNPVTQQIWIAANMSDRILRFDPDSEVFTAYQSPTNVTFMRDFIFTDSGVICTSNANLPAAAIEGGQPKFMCLDPDFYDREIHDHEK